MISYGSVASSSSHAVTNGNDIAKNVLYNIYLNNTDKLEYEENTSFKEILKENLNKYIIDIKELD